MAHHLAQTLSALHRAREAALRAASMRGSRRQVLQDVLREASLCCRTLQDEAWPHAQNTYRWAEPYWRLVAPEEAAAHDAEMARAEAELAAIEAEEAASEGGRDGEP